MAAAGEAVLQVFLGTSPCVTSFDRCLNISSSGVSFKFNVKYTKNKRIGYAALRNVLQHRLRLSAIRGIDGDSHGKTSSIRSKFRSCKCRQVESVDGFTADDRRQTSFPINNESSEPNVQDFELDGQLKNGNGGFASIDKLNSAGSIINTVHKVGAKAVEEEAWDLLRESIVYYCGNPVGTIAANDPNDSSILNYDQVFIRDFIPSGIAFLLKGEYDIVRNFILHTLQLQRKALKEPQKKIGNRMTACQLASIGPAATPAFASTTQQQQQQQHHHQQSEYTQRKIFVSNVGSDLDPQKLYVFFSKYGEIEEGPLGIDKVTGKPKGFCLFVYKTVDAAKKALEEPHKNFEGHMLNCQRAIDGPKQGKSRQHNAQNPHFQRNENAGYVGGAAPASAGHGHLMAPSGPALAPAAAQALNPALGQALTALLATQGAGLGFNPALGQALLGSLGSAAGGAAPMQGTYANQTNVGPGVMGGYANQGGYPNQQMAQSGAGRGQHPAGQYGAPYTGQ